MKFNPTAMEGIFLKYSEKIPFLIFSGVRKLIVDVCKRSVSKTFKINKLREQEAELKSCLITLLLPERLQLRYKKLLKADFTAETLKSGVIFVLNLEIGNIANIIANIEAEVALFRSEFISVLDKFLEFSNSHPRPSSGEQWEVFCSLYFDPFCKDVEAHFFMSFYSVQLVHEKKKSLKEHKLNELRLLKQQPLVLTEEVLEKRLQQLLISKSSKNTSNNSSGRSKPKQKSSSSSATTKKGKQGKDPAPAKSRGNGNGRKANQQSKGKTTTKKRRN